jgi:hypothetical protein
VTMRAIVMPSAHEVRIDTVPDGCRATNEREALKVTALSDC